MACSSFSVYGTKPRRHLKLIYREFERLHLARTETYHSRAWTATTIMPIVVDAVEGTKLYLRITRGSPIPFLVILLIVSLIPFYIKKKAEYFILIRRSGGQRGTYCLSSISRLAHSSATLLSGSFSPGIVAQPLSFT